MQHIPVLLEEIKTSLPSLQSGIYLDATFGGGGHFFALLEARPDWRGVAWDQDPLAAARFKERTRDRDDAGRFRFEARNFSDAPDLAARYDFILADLGVSSFQLDDLARGMSFRSEAPVDFRMNPETGLPFHAWLRQTSETDLARLLEEYGEEPKAKKLAREMKAWPENDFQNAKVFADRIARTLAYGPGSRVHPATRAFQALRIAVNDEMGALRSLLNWAPTALAPGGRLAIISFHSLEDRLVKNRFRDLAKDEGFDILSKKPIAASDAETGANPRSRSAKLRVLERSKKGNHHVAGDHTFSAG